MVFRSLSRCFILINRFIVCLAQIAPNSGSHPFRAVRELTAIGTLLPMVASALPLLADTFLVISPRK
ncbi:MAG: hypothetical protein H7308_19970 [Chthonomonadaceae bacterium]|nr:hypothetical protein [Chthonomonadaceae bacterium]